MLICVSPLNQFSKSRRVAVIVTASRYDTPVLLSKRRYAWEYGGDARQL